MLVAVLAFACLMVPTIGSFYPAPPWPINLFPYIFLGYMLAGRRALVLVHRTQPGSLPGIQRDLERALDASAHEIALSEEEHQHHLHTPGHGFNPARGAGSTGGDGGEHGLGGKATGLTYRAVSAIKVTALDYLSGQVVRGHRSAAGTLDTAWNRA